LVPPVVVKVGPCEWCAEKSREILNLRAKFKPFEIQIEELQSKLAGQRKWRQELEKIEQTNRDLERSVATSELAKATAEARLDEVMEMLERERVDLKITLGKASASMDQHTAQIEELKARLKEKDATIRAQQMTIEEREREIRTLRGRSRRDSKDSTPTPTTGVQDVQKIAELERLLQEQARENLKSAENLKEEFRDGTRADGDRIALLDRQLREKFQQSAALEDKYEKQIKLMNGEIEDLEATMHASQHNKQSAFAEMERLLQSKTDEIDQLKVRFQNQQHMAVQRIQSMEEEIENLEATMHASELDVTSSSVLDDETNREMILAQKTTKLELDHVKVENMTLEKAKAEAEAVSARYKTELERLLEAARKLAEENMALKKNLEEMAEEVPPEPPYEEDDVQVEEPLEEEAPDLETEKENAVEQMWMMRARYKAAGCRLQYAVYLRWATGSVRGYVQIWKTRAVANKLTVLFDDKTEFQRLYDAHRGHRRAAALTLFNSLLTQSSRVGLAVAWSTWIYFAQEREADPNGVKALQKRISDLEQICAMKDVRAGAQIYGVGQGVSAQVTVEYKDEEGSRQSKTRVDKLSVVESISDGISSLVYKGEPDLTYSLTFRTAPNASNVLCQVELVDKRQETSSAFGKLMTMRNGPPPRGSQYTGPGSYKDKLSTSSTSPRGKSPTRRRGIANPRDLLDQHGTTDTSDSIRFNVEL